MRTDNEIYLKDGKNTIVIKKRSLNFKKDEMKIFYNSPKSSFRKTLGLNKVNKDPDDYNLTFLLDGVARFESKSKNEFIQMECPLGKPGDVLWLKEGFAIYDGDVLIYQSVAKSFENVHFMNPLKMPEMYSRHWFMIKNVKVERIQNISDEEIIKEGIDDSDSGFNNSRLIERYETFWSRVNGKKSWTNNEWVWAVDFQIITTTGAPKEGYLLLKYKQLVK